MPSSSTLESCVEVSAKAQVLFLQSLEKWVEAGITCSEHGKTREQRVDAIRNSYRKAMQANINYHTEMMTLAKDAGENDIAALHLSIARCYEAMLSS